MTAPLVVKLGGTTIADQRPVLEEVREVARERPLVLVHGGGRRLTEWLDRLGVESRFEQGLRVTDARAVEVAAAVLGGLVNAELVAALRALGVDAVGLSGVDGGAVTGRRVPGLGLVATVVAVRRELFDALFAAGLVPVVAPLALDEDGAICNVNADDAAAGIAAGLEAMLVLLTDVGGVLDAEGRKVDRLTREAAERLLTSGTISGGMVPKVRAALAGLSGPSSESVIADGRTPRAITAALSDPSFGTRVVPGGDAGDRMPA